MTEEEKQFLYSVGDQLRATPMSWSQIPAEQQTAIIQILKPRPNFSADQREFLSWWWAQVDAQTVETINSNMPSHHVVAPRADANGMLYVNADLFTDAVLPGDRLNRILSSLQDSTLVYRTAEDWPEQEP